LFLLPLSHPGALCISPLVLGGAGCAATGFNNGVTAKALKVKTATLDV
jgi:hypothetical protein